MWTAIFPIDVSKTRLQSAFPDTKYDVGIRKQLKIVSFWMYRLLPLHGLVTEEFDILEYLQLWDEGRWKSMYAGLTPTLIRAFPANAVQWLAWELAINGLRGY